MNVAAREAFEGLDIKTHRPGMIRASMVVVLNFGHRGL